MTTMKISKILQALFYDHSFLTIFRLNFHKVSNELYRSAQPNPYQLKRIIKKYNIKTIINLRGPDEIAILELEREVCKNLNVKFIETEYKSREIPTFQKIKEAKELFESIEYPALIHCKAGADRTGLMALLYLYFIKKVPIKEGLKQLSFIPYGHVNYANTGLVDFYFKKFMEYEKSHSNTDLLSWSKNVADPQKLKQEYKPNKFLQFLVNDVLKRE